MVAHSEDLLSKCAQFRDEGEFIDVRLKVGEDVFPAHRIVLAANSDYFHAMFTDGMKESNQEVIELKDESISPNVLRIIVDSIYTGDLHVNEENVFEVLVAADHLQVTSVVKLCCDFLLIEFVQLRFDVQMYCRVWTIADRQGLKDLQEAAEHKMASMYKDVCESEEFLARISEDQLLSLLSRDDLSAPSETFVFKSVMQWIKHKKEERMAVAAKVIGAVHLGLVDIKIVIEELDTEEMQRDPEVHMQLHEVSIYKHMPSRNNKFAVEKIKPRSMSPVVVAVLPQARMQFFDVEVKEWKSLSSGTPTIEATVCYCAETVGSKLFVAGCASAVGHCIYCYDTEDNVWEMLPHSCDLINNLCIIENYMYAISYDCYQIPQRYSLSKCQWQTFAKVSITSASSYSFHNSGGTILNSKVYVLCGGTSYSNRSYSMQNAVLHCFDPVKNEWQVKASTCQPHFGSSVFVVNNRLYVAGGNVNINPLDNTLYGSPAPVEFYDEENNTWSVVEQKHIPPSNLGAVEIEGRVYFIINKFPIDSGIRIPPGEVYPVPLDEWKNLEKIDKTAVLCYLPVKRESLKTE